jgi:hypothetical protein
MLEKLRYNVGFKLDRVLDDKGFAIIRPARHSRVTGINHVVRLCSRMGAVMGNKQEVSHWNVQSHR